MPSKGIASRGGHVIGYTKSGKPVYGAPRDKKDTQPPQKQSKFSAIAKGAGKVALGVGIAAAGGYVAGGALKSSVKAGMKTFGIRNKFTEEFLHGASQIIHIGSTVEGASLINSGTKQITKETPLKNHSATVAAIASTSAVAASFVSHAGLYTNILGRDVRGGIKIAKKETLRVRKAHVEGKAKAGAMGLDFNGAKIIKPRKK